MSKLLLAVSLAVASLIAVPRAPALAADDSSAATPHCSEASAMMQNAMAPSPGAMMPSDRTMTTDAAYLESMKATLDRQNTMAKMEVACGSNTTVKANAKKAMLEVQSHIDEVTRLLRSIGA